MLKNHRPQKFKNYIGQVRIKKTLKVIIKSTKVQKKQLDHILFFGKSGIGKTTLALIIANEMNSRTKLAQGQNLETKADLLALVSSIYEGDIVFIDEIHSISKVVQELLYSILDEAVIDIIIGPEGASRIMRLKVPRFTLIGATTKAHKLVIPFKNRFQIIFKLANYSIEQMEQIISQLASQHNKEIDNNAISLIASVSQKNPRLANNIFARVLDFMIDANLSKISKQIVIKTLKAIGIHQNGLEDIHIEYLSILATTFKQRWTPIESIASKMQEEQKSLQTNVEPILIELEYLIKSSRGRKITNKGFKYLVSYQFA